MTTTQASEPPLATLLDRMEQQILDTREHDDAARPDWQPIQDALLRLTGDASPCAIPPVVQAAQAFGAACLDYVMAQTQEPGRLEAARQNLAAAKQKVLEEAATTGHRSRPFR